MIPVYFHQPEVEVSVHQPTFLHDIYTQASTQNQPTYTQDENEYGESRSDVLVNPKPRIPFQPLQPSNITSSDENLHRKKRAAVGTLPSSTINKDKLVSINIVFQKYPKLLCESKVGTLLVKLAKDSFLEKTF